MIRKPQVAGAFYPDTKEALEAMLTQFVVPDKAKLKALGVMVPHAGYIYSGSAAGKVFSKINIPDKVIIIGPNHRGVGEPFAVFASGAWRSPLGDVPVAEHLAESLLASSRYLKADSKAHQFEHSLEVQIPFLQYCNPAVHIVPVSIGEVYDTDSLRSIGDAIGNVIREAKEDVLIIASSDMTHYESKEAAAEKDKPAIEAVLALDEEKLWNVVRDNRISMCGVFPTFVMIRAVKYLSPHKAELAVYTNSGVVTGDFSEVVAYAGIIISGEQLS